MTTINFSYSQKALNNYFIKTGKMIDAKQSVQLDSEKLSEKDRTLLLDSCYDHFILKFPIEEVGQDIISACKNEVESRQQKALQEKKDCLEKWHRALQKFLDKKQDYIDSYSCAYTDSKTAKKGFDYDIQRMNEAGVFYDKEAVDMRIAEVIGNAKAREDNQEEGKRLYKQKIEDKKEKVKQWIDANGSKYLKNLLHNGFEYSDVFNTEYAAQFGFSLYEDETGQGFDEDNFGMRTVISSEELDKLMELKKKYPDFGFVYGAINDEPMIQVEVPLMSRYCFFKF